MKMNKQQQESAHALAMLGLQSDRYQTDSEYRDAVDAVLAWTRKPQPAASPTSEQLATQLHALQRQENAEEGVAGVRVVIAYLHTSGRRAARGAVQRHRREIAAYPKIVAALEELGLWI